MSIATNICLICCATALAVPAPTPGAVAEEKPSLAFCSLRYGHLMTDHWLTADVAQQIERGLFYRGAETGALRIEFEKLQRSVAAAEQQLDEARSLYRTLFATNTPEGTDKLNKLLAQITIAESENERAATALLQSLGEQNSKFRAVPVTKDDLFPAWDGRKLVDKNYRPKRIIFGSTGKAGDDRTLPLRFDFGSGIFGFYISMTASNKLDVSAGMLDGTDPVCAWMKANHSGYHYWAGVYNNQNTYVARWFLKEHKDEEDVWMKL